MLATTLLTRRWGLEPAEWPTSAVAVVVSSTLYLQRGHPYLAPGVLGDLLGFGVLTVALLVTGKRLRHEALLCLAAIGVVHLVGVRWVLRVGSPAWWAVFAAGLGGYLLVRHRVLSRPAR